MDESRGVEPASGSVHPKVHQSDEVTEAGIASAVHGDGESGDVIDESALLAIILWDLDAYI